MVIYLELPKYLREWVINEFGGKEPVVLPKGSQESDILELFLKPVPPDAAPDLPRPGSVAVQIPVFRGKDPAYYHYLPARARLLLSKCIYTRFRVQMWSELHSMKNIRVPITDLVYAWMEKHGIADDDTSWETIRQMYFRARKFYEGLALKQAKEAEKNAAKD